MEVGYLSISYIWERTDFNLISFLLLTTNNRSDCIYCDWRRRIFRLLNESQHVVVTYFVVSNWLSRRETGSVCSILKLSFHSLVFKSFSEVKETSRLFSKILENFRQFSNIYHICWPCIVFYHLLHYSQVCVVTCIVTEIFSTVECSVPFVAQTVIWTGTNTG